MKSLGMLFLAMNKLIDQCLHTDPTYLSQLSKFAGKVIQVSIVDFNLNFFILLNEHGMLLQQSYQQIVDVKISGKLSALWQMLKLAKKINSNIHISGDIELVQEFGQLFRGFSIDWEGLLANYVGDIVAHQTFYQFSKIAKLCKHSFNSLRESTSEYLLEEVRVMAPAEQLEDFYEQIADIRDDVERAEQRLIRLHACNKQRELV